MIGAPPPPYETDMLPRSPEEQIEDIDAAIRREQRRLLAPETVRMGFVAIHKLKTAVHARVQELQKQRAAVMKAVRAEESAAVRARASR